VEVAWLVDAALYREDGGSKANQGST
jgi:hypothetical protein